MQKNVWQNISNSKNGDIAVGINISKIYHGKLCAEDLATWQLNANIEDILMTPAIRPRTGETVPVCERCQTKYGIGNLIEGTKFK